MENQDLDLIGQTVGSMPYKIGIVDKDGNVTTQFVAKSSTNRIDIPQSSLGAGGSYGLPSIVNLFTGSAVGNVFLAGPTPNYDNVQDGLLITLGNQTLTAPPEIMTDPNFVGIYWPQYTDQFRMDLSSIGLMVIKVPKEELIINNSFDVSDQLLPYVGKVVQGQYHYNNQWTTINYSFNTVSFEGSIIKILPNETINLNLTVQVKEKTSNKFNHVEFPIPVIQVNDYKN